MGFSAMLAEEYILIVPFAIGCLMVRLFFATSIEIYSASPFLFIFSYRADESQNISTAESPDTLAAMPLKKTSTLTKDKYENLKPNRTQKFH
jgi:hypothetical protein